MSQQAERECMYQACATDPRGYAPTLGQVVGRVVGVGVGYLLFQQAQTFDFGPLVRAAKSLRGGAAKTGEGGA